MRKQFLTQASLLFVRLAVMLTLALSGSQRLAGQTVYPYRDSLREEIVAGHTFMTMKRCRKYMTKRERSRVCIRIPKLTSTT